MLIFFCEQPKKKKSGARRKEIRRPKNVSRGDGSSLRGGKREREREKKRALASACWSSKQERKKKRVRPRKISPERATNDRRPVRVSDVSRFAAGVDNLSAADDARTPPRIARISAASKQIGIAGERRGEAGHRGTKRRVLRYLARSDAND